MSDLLDDLIAEGFRELPIRAVPGQSPARPARSPLEQESRFIRYAAWFDRCECRCGRFEISFDGVFEEREFLRGGGRHWMKCATAPHKSEAGVTYTRKHKIEYCAVCSGAFGWPPSTEHEVTTNPMLVRVETTNA